MAQDIKIAMSADLLEGDIVFSGGDLLREEGLETAVLMSLFTDRRADADDVLPDPNSIDRRGWWGDQITDYDDEKMGSRLWLLERAKTTDTDITTYKVYIEECLKWMLDDGVALAIEVEVERQDRGDGTAILAASISIHQSDGTEVAIKFDDLWKFQVGA